ncbi:hypothetical protein ACUY28_06005 [Corynebacterium sanguinis]
MPTTQTEQANHHSLRDVLQHIGLTTTMAFIMLLLYLGGFHNPAPRDMDIAIVTDNEAVATTLADNISEAVGDGIKFHRLDTQAEAEEQLRNRDIHGAFIPGPDSAELLTASAASATTAEVVRAIFHKVAQTQSVPLYVEDVVPLDSKDPVGQNSFFYMIALSVGSYATSIAIGGAGYRQPLRIRALLAAGAAVVISTLFLATAHLVFGLFPGHVGPVWALSLIYSAAILFFGVGMHPLLGRFCTLTYATLFVGMNFTSAGGAFSPELQNGFFRTIHTFWIGSGFIESERNISYFPHLPIAPHVAILVGWLVLGVASLGVAAYMDRLRKPWESHPHTRQEKDKDIERTLEENVAPA